MVSNTRIMKTSIKNTITDLVKDKFIKNFIYSKTYNLSATKSMARLLGFEPRTSWYVAKRSIQLSYRRTCINYQKKLCK